MNLGKDRPRRRQELEPNFTAQVAPGVMAVPAGGSWVTALPLPSKRQRSPERFNILRA